MCVCKPKQCFPSRVFGSCSLKRPAYRWQNMAAGRFVFHVDVHTCALHRAGVTINRLGDWGEDVAQQEVAVIQPLQTLPTKKINKDIIKPSLSLNDYSHKCFNHPSLRTQLCVFVWVCVTVL